MIPGQLDVSGYGFSANAHHHDNETIGHATTVFSGSEPKANITTMTTNGKQVIASL